jgi:phage shock protein PspC (stress-responsive transcriptional regulator)
MSGTVAADDHKVMTTSTATPVKKLRRSSTDRMLAGVCGGWAEILGVDAAILRIAFAAAMILGVGTPALLYAVCWILMPEGTAGA